MSDLLSPEAVARQLREMGVPDARIERAVQQLQGTAPVKRGKRTAPSGAKKLRDLEAKKFRLWCNEQGLPQPVAEYWFAREAMGRNWRFDWAWEPEKVALEVNGGIFRRGGGAHQGKGHLRDMEKLNAAQSLGWVVFQVVPRDLYSRSLLDILKGVKWRTDP